MNLRKLIFTNNDCYKAGKKITVKGLMLHSTGVNNPTLRRYVNPDDGLLGQNAYNNHWNQPKPGGKQVCVHGFIGKLKDGSIATYQTLPWNHRGWHAGGKANDTHIGIEICEDSTNDKVYFDKVYQEAVELFAYLCKEFNLNPLKDIIDHSEGYKKGLASNHADVGHWFKKHGKSMNTFRSDVKALLDAEIVVDKYTLLVDLPVYTNSANARDGITPTGTYKAGEYFIYNKANGMINITRNKGKPGGWINPAHNILPEVEEPIIEEPVEPPVEEEPIELPPLEEPDLEENVELSWIDSIIILINKFLEWLDNWLK